MLKNLPLGKRRIIIVALLSWAVGTIWAFVAKNPEFFAAMGSFSLCISFSLFLTDRYSGQESRRHWDSQILTQSRMIWRYFQNVEQHKEYNDPTPQHKLRDQITTNFEDLLAAKAQERGLEKFRTELFFTITGTLQWGFGAIFIRYFYA